jgi:hypothetical protein
MPHPAIALAGSHPIAFAVIGFVALGSVLYTIHKSNEMRLPTKASGNTSTHNNPGPSRRANRRHNPTFLVTSFDEFPISEKPFYTDNASSYSASQQTAGGQQKRNQKSSSWLDRFKSPFKSTHKGDQSQIAAGNILGNTGSHNIYVTIPVIIQGDFNIEGNTVRRNRVTLERNKSYGKGGSRNEAEAIGGTVAYIGRRFANGALGF